ncbi:hypothetical protein KKE60_06635 [Patescibacteria group bacterium]|nr:hypothetical protein [Patescibacteria group bacterium]
MSHTVDIDVNLADLIPWEKLPMLVTVIADVSLNTSLSRWGLREFTIDKKTSNIESVIENIQFRIGNLMRETFEKEEKKIDFSEAVHDQIAT